MHTQKTANAFPAMHLTNALRLNGQCVESVTINLAEFDAAGAPTALPAPGCAYSLCQAFRRKGAPAEIVFVPALFRLGHVVVTPAALDLLQEHGKTPYDFTGRHLAGDWSSLDPADAMENAAGAKKDGRVFSSFQLKDGNENSIIWVITEHDRSVTTVMVPSDY